MDAAAGLVGRDEECATLEALVAGTTEHASGALVLIGEPGVGRTALLDHAAAQAARLPQAPAVVRCAGVEPETDLPFAGLHRLLLPLLDHVGALPPAQRAALGGVLGLGHGHRELAPDRFLVGAAVLALLAEGATATGLVAVVDDAHRLDRESAQALAFAGRRLGAEGVALLFATVDGDPGGFDPAGLPRLHLRGLDADAARQLLAAQGPHLADGVRTEIVRMTGGNPLALLELPAALTAEQRRGTAPLPAQMPLGDRVRGALLARVHALPDPTRRSLLLVAAEPWADLGTLAAAAGRLGLDLDALESAEGAGVVTVDGQGVRFASAMTRSAVYSDAPFLRRRAVHAALAEAYADTRPDRWAWHRALIAEGSDPVLAGELERSADRALARAGYAATASMLERAAELSPDDAARGRRLVAAASAAWSCGQSERATRLLAAAERLTLPPITGARASVVRGTIEAALGPPAAAVPILAEASRTLAEEDPRAAARALVSAMGAAVVAGDFSETPRLAELADGLPAEVFPLTGLVRGLAHLVQGAPLPAVEALRAFLESVSDSDDPRWLGFGGVAASLMGDAPVALSLYDQAVAQARRSGAVALLPALLEDRALVEVGGVALALAEADADESLRLAAELALPRPPLLAKVTMAAVEAHRGRFDQARRWSTEAAEGAERYGVRMPIGLALSVDLGMSLVQGHLEEAMRISRRIESGDPRIHPLVSVTTFAHRVEARVRAGEPVSPEAVAGYEAWIRLSGNQPRYLALLARSRALVTGTDEADRWFTEAVRLHERSDAPFEQARTRQLYGEFLRRRRRPGEAREQLRSAVEIFDRLGCLSWSERTRVELRATGETVGTATPDRFGELTPQELQIVRLVSTGMSNRQVAGQLFLSPRTVEYHLAKVYPKLGLGSRAELIRIATRHLAEPAAS